jgi:tetratricopeptide (TPR) repeat protein
MEDWVAKMRWTVLLLLCFSWASSSTAAVRAQISKKGDTVHLELAGSENWDYDIQRKTEKGKTYVQLTIPAVDESSLKMLKSFSSSLIPNVQFLGNGPDGKIIFQVQTVNGKVDAFDYLTEKPSRLIVDFFESNEDPEPPTAKKTNAKIEAKPAKKVTKVIPLPKKGEVKRAPADVDVLVVNEQGKQIDLKDAVADKPMNAKGIFDGGDPNYERFAIKDFEIKEDSVIASQDNVYLDFPMLREDSPYLAILQSRPPVYSINPREDEENKQARLLLTLFEKKRFNVFLKTCDWFFNKFPESEYTEIISFMRADALFGIWLDNRNANDFDLAMLRYRKALEKYPDSPLVERSMMLMGFATLDRGDYLGTLRLFQSHISKRPNSPNKDIAELAMADAFIRISKFDEATKIYNELEKNGDSEKYKIFGAYLKGDVAYLQGDQEKRQKNFDKSKAFYQTAINDYQAAIKKYPDAVPENPGAFYNQASAYFQLGDRKKSLDTYRDFLKRFPSRPESGYAMTRVGEILDSLGADKSRVIGTYEETYFRYGDTPSSVVARLRMLSERMPQMKEKEVEKAVKDIAELSTKANLPKLDQFATLMISDGYNRRKEYPKAVDLLEKYYQANPSTADTKLLSNRIVKSINEHLKDLVEKGDFIGALKLHNKYVDNRLKGSNRLDTIFTIGRAYEQAGVAAQAESLFKDVLNKIYSLKGTKAGKERMVVEHLPSEDRLNLRIAAVEMEQRKFAQAYESLRNIKDPQAMTEMEQIERIQMAATLLDKRGEPESAIRYLTELLKVWSGIPELVADPYLHLAELEIKQKKTDAAIDSLKKVSKLMEDSKKVSPQVHRRSLELLGQMYVEKGETNKAIATFEKALDLYEKQSPMSSYRYKVGQLYFKKGEIKNAEKAWNELKNEKNDFWYKMAQEQLKGSEWKNEYQKYIQRIPAMAEPEKRQEKSEAPSNEKGT